MTGNGTTTKGNSLRSKVLIPFIAILLALGSAATIGTILIISETLENNADKRLSAYQRQIYAEIRNLEERLLRRSNLLELSYIIDQTFQESDITKLNTIENLIDDSLVSEGMLARYISPQAVESLPDKKLSKLVNLTKTSLKAQIRFTTDIGPQPAMTVVRPIIINEKISQFIFIQASMGDNYLNKISAPLNIKTALFDLSGTFLVGSQKDYNFSDVSKENMSRALNGERVFFSQGRFLKQRNLIYAIPLGTTDMLIVQLEMPLTDISTIVGTMATRSAVSILIALIIGGYIYYRLIGQILTPAQNMMMATKAISEGNLNYRIEHIPTGEFGELASSFNSMMQGISDRHDQSIVKERELTKAQEELKYKDILEEKNQTIVNTNNELKEHLKEISTLLQLNQAMASTLDLDTLFDRVINSLCELLECHMASLLLYNRGDETLEVSHSIGIPQNVLSDASFSLNEGISGEAARTHKAIYVKDLKKDERYLNYKGELPPEGSLLSMPLLSKDRLNGVLNLHHKQVDGFTEYDIKMARAVANQVAVSIENTQLYEQAKQQSITDELTGLANRRHFQDILQREIVHAQRYSTNISMIMIDIDHFKKYNDTHGHLQGDIALKEAANIFLQNTRGIDLTARFGGEEFIILLPKTTIAGARITAEKLREIFEAEEFTGEGDSQPGGKMTISLGVASYPEHIEDMNQLLDLADRALYQAKKEGRNRVAIWNNSITLGTILS